MRRRIPILLILFLLPACASRVTERGVLVKVTNNSNVAGILQLKARFSNQGSSDTLLLPSTPLKTPMVFPTAFSITLPSNRTGEVNIAVDGLDSSGTSVANGTGVAILQANAFVTTTVDLGAGALPCTGGGSCVDASVRPEVHGSIDSADAVGSDTGVGDDVPSATGATPLRDTRAHTLHSPPAAWRRRSSAA